VAYSVSLFTNIIINIIIIIIIRQFGRTGQLIRV